MVPGWKPEHAAIVERYVNEYLGGEANADDIYRKLAEQTNALPAYADIGGIILLYPSGDLVLYDDCGMKPEPVNDRTWENIALISVADQYPQLADLRPVRPNDSPDCTACAGRGRVTRHELLCGVCGGTGWREAAPRSKR
jgi:hypothetical protein